MNCHGNHDNNNNGNEHGKGHKGHLSHILMMALCCGAPILILLLVPLLSKAGGSGISKLLIGIAPFLCPLMMVFMIPMMFKGGKDKGNKDNTPPINQVQLEERTQDK